MPESSLSLTFGDLKGEVARYLSFGGGGGRDSRAATLNVEQQKDVEQAVQAGLRQFYWPPPVGKLRRGHEWSWLHQTYSMATVADQADYDLPAHVYGIEGQITYATDDDGFTSIRVTSEQRIREMRQIADYTGYPLEAAVRTKERTGNEGTRKELLLYPTPDTAYQINFRYNLIPEGLGDNDEVPHGGPPFAELLLESCLAAAERRYDEHESVYHQKKFEQLLVAAVAFDTSVEAPSHLGYNGDWSEGSAVRTRHPGYTGVDQYTDANGTVHTFSL